MNLDWSCPYPSRRMPVFAPNVVAASQPLAVQAGLAMLRQGGNAVDAALAAAVTLTVVEPTGCGIGGDAFALVWDGAALHGLNSSGRSPAAWTPERFAGRRAMPAVGWDTVTVPGAVAAWAALSRRFGRLPFGELFRPAIGYARGGFPVAPVTAARWREAESLYPGMTELRRVFFPAGRAPLPGEIFRNPDQAATLEAIAASLGEAFYRGALAEAIAACAAAEGGALTTEDLAAHAAEWVAPLSIAFRGVVLHELPPNGQGIAALIALGILGRFERERLASDTAEGLHLQIEAMKRAFAVLFREAADPAHMRIDPRRLLDAERLAAEADAIRPDRAGPPPADPAPPPGGTVYLAAADASGMMVSFIQSNYTGFGSGVVVPGTGIALHNRGCGFVLDAGHPNRVGGGKRPFHTIIPAIATRAGQALLAFGVMGAHMQPQGHVQMMTRIFDGGENPQAACDAPRWHLAADGAVALEPGFPPEAVAGLRRRGHRLISDPPVALFGGGQLVLRLEGCYAAASDPRKDGQAAGF